MARKYAPIHPGEVLREDFMKPLGLSINRLAIELRKRSRRIQGITAIGCQRND